MGKQVSITQEDLYRLYWGEHKSSIEIAKLYHCRGMTIRNRIREFGIQKRSASDARMRYKKQNFSGDSVERSYLLGFRLGDLSAYQTSTRSDLIIVRCHTTQMTQVALIRDLFFPYGHITISTGVHGYNINCYVNTTFKFLLPKYTRVPKIVEKSSSSVWAFIAGYVDVEESFGINQGKARFKLDSYDVHVLDWMVHMFQEFSLSVKFRRIALKGQPQYKTGIFHKDLWRLEINEAKSILLFIMRIRDYIRHEKRKTDMIVCLNNIYIRKQKGSIA